LTQEARGVKINRRFKALVWAGRMSVSDSTLEIDVPEVADGRAAPAEKAAAGGQRSEVGGQKSEVEDESPAGNARTRPWKLLGAVPSWLVSLTIHLGLVLLLAVLIVPAQSKSRGTFLFAAASEMEEVEFFEPVKIEAVDVQTLQMTAAAVSSADVTSTSLTDAADLGAVSATLTPDEVDVPVSGEIGELFTGVGGRAMGSVLPSGADKSAQFFGVKASGRRFVFIVDSSNSMRGGKFDAAKEELMYAIRRLSKEQAFYIIFFDQNAERMLLPPSTEPELLPVPATAQNINRAQKWVDSVVNELRTDPYDAVKFAVEMVPDAIYLLTDGKFTDRGLTERFLKDNNLIDDPLEGRRPKVVIHTICFWQKDGEETLQAIAKDYGGTYRFVAPAPGMKKKK
jgi:hypothetical protein